jgi:hypothetical protein
LAEFIAIERPASVRAWIDDATLAKVRDAVAIHGTERLKPIFDHYRGAIGYDLLRIAVAFLDA